MSVYIAGPRISPSIEIIPIGRDPVAALFDVANGTIERLRLNGIGIEPRDYVFLHNGLNLLEIEVAGPGGSVSETYVFVNDISAGYSISMVGL